MIENIIWFICGIAVGVNIGRWIFIKIARGWEEIADGYKELYEREQHDCTCPTPGGYPIVWSECPVHGLKKGKTP